jgi:ArsR family transcriptional regulator
MKQSVAAFFKVLGCEQRIRILQLLDRESRCICEIRDHFDIDKTTLSRHVKELVSSGIIQEKKEGVKKILRVKDPRILELIQDAERIISEKY